MSAKKVFISYSWQDAEVARNIAKDLKCQGNDVWIDCEETRGGDNLTERISSALDWCDTVFLLWTESAQNSDWVKLEWTSALALRKRIIPCVMGKATLPAILANTLFIQHRDYQVLLQTLKRALEYEPSRVDGVQTEHRAAQIDHAIGDVADLAATLQKVRTATFQEPPMPEAKYFDDGLDELVESVDRQLRKREYPSQTGGQIGTGDGIYEDPTVQRLVMGIDKAKAIRDHLFRLNDTGTYRARVPLALLLLGLLADDIVGDIACSRENRKKLVHHLRTLGVPETVDLVDAVDTLGAVEYDRWV